MSVLAYSLRLLIRFGAIELTDPSARREASPDLNSDGWAGLRGCASQFDERPT